MASKQKRLRDTMGIDPDRVISTALQAALGETEQPGKRRHPARMLVAGAGVAAVAAVGQRRMPRLAAVPLRMGLHKLGEMTHAGDLADALHDRLMGYEDEEDDELRDEEDDDFVDDGIEDAEPVDDEEPHDEEDDADDPDDEDFDDGFDDDPPEDDGPPETDDGEPEPDEDDLDDEDDLEEEPELSEEDPPEDEELDDVDDDEELDPDEDDEELAARGVRVDPARRPPKPVAHA